MDVKNNLPGLKSYLNENRLNSGGAKTSIDHSKVESSEQNNVDLNLNSENSKNKQQKSKTQKNNIEELLNVKNTEEIKDKKSESEIKAVQLKLLNLI